MQQATTTASGEWWLFCLALGLLTWPIVRRLDLFRNWRWAVASVLLLTVALAWAWLRQVRGEAEVRSAFQKSIPREEPYSGYVSSDRCHSCHPQQYDSWHASFHRTMTQPAIPGAVQADFNNVSLELDGQSYRLERRGDEFWAEMVDPDWVHDQAVAERDYARGARATPPDLRAQPPRVWKRISLITGSHHFQAFWVTSSRPGNIQFGFPFAWLIDEKRWVPRRDTFIREANQPLVQIWNMNCIQCHTTAGHPNQQAHSAVFQSRVAEMGIACESCHGPAEEHVRLNQDFLRRYQLHREDRGDPSIVNPSRLDSKKSSQVCGQCHGIKWTLDHQHWLQHGSSFRPGQDLDQAAAVVLPKRFASENRLPEAIKNDREFLNTLFWPDGVVRVAGREYNAIVETGCFQRGNLSCLSCHSMHHSPPDDQLAARMEGNQACLQCHTSYRDKLQEHTRHLPDSPGSQCYNCHMPHTTYGLLKAIRSHEIESPNARTTLESGRLNGCNLCHLDRSLQWTAEHLSKWFGQPAPELTPDQEQISAALLWALRGDAAQRALAAWNLGWEPARKTSGESWLAPFLIELLDDPYAAVRCIAHRSLRSFPGFEQLAYDFVKPQQERRAAQQQAREIWNRQHRGRIERSGASVLLEANGELHQQTIDRLLRERDTRPVELVE